MIVGFRCTFNLKSTIKPLYKRTIATGYMRLRTNHSSRVEPLAKLEIELTDAESQLCTLLDGCTQKMKDDNNLITSCRIAGGWVRDKLLGSQSNDIDIALTDMMGYTFAEHFVSYAESQNFAVKSLVKIESNPDQSKHLETARTTVLGITLDFVNLRSEEYAEHSRIPAGVSFGTPLQDALRRDLTINALFYNVHSRTVEDFTLKGLDDLRNGIIRTPLAPTETFQDDPLRVIRCVRFASRFSFDMVPELQDAARDPVIQGALATKLSRERVGEELDKMLKGPNPLLAMEWIHNLSLHSSIFSISPAITASFTRPPASYLTSLAATTLLQTLLHPQTSSPPDTTILPAVHPALLSIPTTDRACRARLFLAAALMPYHGITYLDSKKKIRLAVEVVIREGLKLGTQNHYLDGIPPLYTGSDLLKSTGLEGYSLAETSERVAIGLLLRDKNVHYPIVSSHWTTTVLFSLLQELVPLYDAANDRLKAESAANLIERYNAFIYRVEELKLPAAIDARPILDGRELVKALGAQPGPWTGKVLAKVVEWQLQYPDGGKDECVSWLKTEYKAGVFQVVEPEGSSMSEISRRRTRANDDSAATKMKKPKR